MAQLVSIASDARSLQARKNQAGSFIPRATPYARFDACLMKGVPMAVIAEQLGHADTRMTEKHYAHLAPSYVAETIRAHFPTLGITGESSVMPMRREG